MPDILTKPQHVADERPTDNTRPATACLLCPAPRRAGHWRLADPGYRTDAGCLDRLREQLAEIPLRYVQLNPRPGSQGDHGSRGAPGFGSRAPASDHVIAMRDRRSSVRSTTWRGADERVHFESERPPLSVHAVLVHLVGQVVQARRSVGPKRDADVPDLARWLDGQLDWVTRQDTVTYFAGAVRQLVNQLRPVTGEPGQRHIGLCPNTIDTGEQSKECAARLYAPLNGGDSIHCRSCERVWPREEWLRLGTIMQAS